MDAITKKNSHKPSFYRRRDNCLHNARCCKCLCRCWVNCEHTRLGCDTSGDMRGPKNLNFTKQKRVRVCRYIDYSGHREKINCPVFRCTSFHGKKGCYKWVFRPVEQPRWNAMMLSQRKPFPFIQWLLIQIGHC